MLTKEQLNSEDLKVAANELRQYVTDVCVHPKGKAYAEFHIPIAHVEVCLGFPISRGMHNQAISIPIVYGERKYHPERQQFGSAGQWGNEDLEHLVEQALMNFILSDTRGEHGRPTLTL